MKKNRLLCCSKMQDYVRLFWEKQQVIKSYDKIESFLLSRKDLSEQYINLLAQPKINEYKKEIAWYSDAFKSTPQKFTNLSSEDKQTYGLILEETLEAYRILVDKEQIPYEWRNLLKSAVSCVDYDSIYCGDGKIVFTNWGTRKKEQIEHEMITLKVNKKKDSLKNVPENSQKNYTSDIIENIKDNEFHQNYDESNIEEENGFFNENDNKEDQDPKKNFISEIIDSNNSNSVEDKQNNIINEDIEEEEEEEEEDNTNILSNQEQSKTDSECSVNQRVSKKRRSWLKWLLAILALLLLFILLIKNCSGNNDNNVLPPEMGVIPPINQENIGTSPDSLSHVIVDRLNVLIKDKGKVEEFATVFKIHYPEDVYKIVYYDTLIQRVQIQIPIEEKEKLRNDIPRIMNTFDIYLWDESVFKSNLVPNDPAFNNKKESWYFELCKVFDGWKISKGKDDIIVAIIDDGFDINHVEFSNKITKPYNITTRSSRILNQSSGEGHGTHVSGTAIGLADNYTGGSGIAPNCKLMPIQVANSAGIITSTAVIDAVLYAIFNNADVINLSLGTSFTPFLQLLPEFLQQNIIDNNYLQEEEVWNQVFDVARKQNSIIVMAAGNENVLTGIDPMQRSAYGIKVSAVSWDKSKADFSNYGSYSTISAPGVNIFNSIPNNRFDYMSGTSMASPIVAGAVALMKSTNKKLTSQQIVKILRTTGMQIPYNIGPILQLGKALEAVEKGNITSDYSVIDNETNKDQDDIKENREEYNNDIINDESSSAIGVIPPGKGKKPKPDNISCDELKNKIDSLQFLTDILRQKCPEFIKPDTLRLPINGSVDDLKGRWRSTTTLWNSDKEKVTLYFDFFGSSQGQIYFVEVDNTIYSSPTKVLLPNGELHIEQLENAKSRSNSNYYDQYRFVCKQYNIYKSADCTGTQISNPIQRVNFKLVRVN